MLSAQSLRPVRKALHVPLVLFVGAELEVQRLIWMADANESIIAEFIAIMPVSHYCVLSLNNPVIMIPVKVTPLVLVERTSE